MKNFTCISVNHKLCGQAFRSLFTFDSAQCEKLLFDVKDLSPVLICTCNRTELYFCGTPEEGIRLLCEQSGVEIAKLKRKVMIFTDKTAVKKALQRIMRYRISGHRRGRDTWTGSPCI